MAPGCRPGLGGLLTELSWRWIFFVNIPVGVAALASFPLIERLY